jgi:hypothetical protein
MLMRAILNKRPSGYVPRADLRAYVTAVGLTFGLVAVWAALVSFVA